MQALYFAWVRERIGLDAEPLDLPEDIKTVAALLDWLAQRSEGHGAALADRSLIRVALDNEFAGPEASLAGVAEVAIFPPVTGG